MSRAICLIAILILFVFWTGVDAAEEMKKADQPRTGQFKVSLKERHPLSAFPVMTKRFGWHSAETADLENGKKKLYKIEQESFSVYVPSGYDGSKDFGLMVWINSGDNGNPRRAWKQILDTYNLIWIGANKSGNERYVPDRYALAVDGANYITKTYRVDADRIYVCGRSGGGRCASAVALMYADVFTGGGCYIVGCNLEKVADRKMLGLIRRRRFVFLTGSEDFNRVSTQGVYEGYKKNGFWRSQYLEVPGMGHSSPPFEWLEKATLFLDAPLKWRVKPNTVGMLDGVELNHFKATAKMLTPGRAIKPKLLRIKKAAEKGGVEKAEAEAIIAATRKWAEAELERCKKLAAKQPSLAYTELDRLIDTIKGLALEEEAQAIYEPLKKDKKVKALAELRADIAEVMEKIDEKGFNRGFSKDLEKLKKKLEKLGNEAGLSEAMKQEIEALNQAIPAQEVEVGR